MILVLPPSLPCYLTLFHVISQAFLRALLMPGVRLDCSGNTEKYENMLSACMDCQSVGKWRLYSRNNGTKH